MAFHARSFVCSFESDRPLAFNAPVVLEDSLGNIYPVNVTATADNCLLTCYPFIAQHRLDHQIVCQEVRLVVVLFHRVTAVPFIHLLFVFSTESCYEYDS